MLPDLGDIAAGPGDGRHWRQQSLTFGGEAPAALVGAYPAEGPGWVSDASHARGLDDLNPGWPATAAAVPLWSLDRLTVRAWLG